MPSGNNIAGIDITILVTPEQNTDDNTANQSVQTDAKQEVRDANEDELQSIEFELEDFKTEIRKTDSDVQVEVANTGYAKLFRMLDENKDEKLTDKELNKLTQNGADLSKLTVQDIQTFVNQYNYEQEVEETKEKTDILTTITSILEKAYDRNKANANNAVDSGNASVSTLKKIFGGMIKTVDTIGSTIGDAIESIGDTIEKAGEVISSVGETISDTFSDTVKKVKAKLQSGSFAKGVFKDKAEFIVNCSNKYGIDPFLVLAIMAMETGYGTSNGVKNKNNPGGFMDPSTNYSKMKSFSTLENGIEAVIKNLANNYIKKGLTTISKIGAKYCPVGAANDPNGTNGQWIPSVTKIYNNLTGKNITKNTQIN